MYTSDQILDIRNDYWCMIDPTYRTLQELIKTKNKHIVIKYRNID